MAPLFILFFLLAHTHSYLILNSSIINNVPYANLNLMNRNRVFPRLSSTKIITTHKGSTFEQHGITTTHNTGSAQSQLGLYEGQSYLYKIQDTDGTVLATFDMQIMDVDIKIQPSGNYYFYPFIDETLTTVHSSMSKFWDDFKPNNPLHNPDYKHTYGEFIERIVDDYPYVDAHASCKICSAQGKSGNYSYYTESSQILEDEIYREPYKTGYMVFAHSTKANACVNSCGSPYDSQSLNPLASLRGVLESADCVIGFCSINILQTDASGDLLGCNEGVCSPQPMIRVLRHGQSISSLMGAGATYGVIIGDYTSEVVNYEIKITSLTGFEEPFTATLTPAQPFYTQPGLVIEISDVLEPFTKKRLMMPISGNGPETAYHWTLDGKGGWPWRFIKNTYPLHQPHNVAYARPSHNFAINDRFTGGCYDAPYADDRIKSVFRASDFVETDSAGRSRYKSKVDPANSDNSDYGPCDTAPHIYRGMNHRYIEKNGRLSKVKNGAQGSCATRSANETYTPTPYPPEPEARSNTIEYSDIFTSSYFYYAKGANKNGEFCHSDKNTACSSVGHPNCCNGLYTKVHTMVTQSPSDFLSLVGPELGCELDPTMLGDEGYGFSSTVAPQTVCSENSRSYVDLHTIKSSGCGTGGFTVKVDVEAYTITPPETGVDLETVSIESSGYCGTAGGGTLKVVDELAITPRQIQLTWAEHPKINFDTASRVLTIVHQSYYEIPFTAPCDIGEGKLMELNSGTNKTVILNLAPLLETLPQVPEIDSPSNEKDSDFWGWVTSSVLGAVSFALLLFIFVVLFIIVIKLSMSIIENRTKKENAETLSNAIAKKKE